MKKHPRFKDNLSKFQIGSKKYQNFWARRGPNICGQDFFNFS